MMAKIDKQFFIRMLHFMFDPFFFPRKSSVAFYTNTFFLGYLNGLSDGLARAFDSKHWHDWAINGILDLTFLD